MSSVTSQRDLQDAEAQSRHIQELLERQQFVAAKSAANRLTQALPEHRDARYMLAVSQRYLNEIDGALATLAQLQRLHPGFSRLYQEQGHCHVVKRDPAQAIRAYLTAVNINPALPASWAKLEILYRMTGDHEHSAMAADHVATLARLPPEVVTATALFSDGDLRPAEHLIRAFLLKHGDHVEAMRLLARIGMARAVFDDAEILLAAVLEKSPGYDLARMDYARVLLERHKHPQAQDQLRQLLQKKPQDREIKTLYATATVGVGELDKAVELYRDLLPEDPKPEELHLSIAHALKTLGRHEEATLAYRAAMAARPDFGDAYWSLANLKTSRFAEAEFAQMLRAEAATATTRVDRYHLCFALGKALEDRSEFERSYGFYERGNVLKRAETDFRIEPIERNTRLQKAVCTRELFAARAGWGAASTEPIFIVGLPRAGSTLLEQILASHSQVEGTHELADIPRLAHEFQGRDPDLDNPSYPSILAELSAEDCRALGQKYLRDTRVYRTDKPHFIDKMPNNFRHLGLIRLILPKARIIDARREPMACCFSNFKQLFASGQEFTYGIEDIARYYRTYLELMRHWEHVLPGQILRVHHEDVVDDLEHSVRRLLDFCGLPFESACLEFHRTSRSVRTASSEQVRQPLFRDGLDQWMNYEPWLSPLKAALGDALKAWRDPFHTNARSTVNLE